MLRSACTTSSRATTSACRRILPTRQPEVSFSLNLDLFPVAERALTTRGIASPLWKWIDGGSRESRFSGGNSRERRLFPHPYRKRKRSPRTRGKRNDSTRSPAVPLLTARAVAHPDDVLSAGSHGHA